MRRRLRDERPTMGSFSTRFGDASLQGVLLVLGGLIAIGAYRFLSCQIHAWIEKAVSDGRRAYEFTLNSDGGDCDDPILWLFPCFHLAGVKSELKAPHRGAGCGGNNGGGADLCASRPGTSEFACCNPGSAEHHKRGDPDRSQLHQFGKN